MATLGETLRETRVKKNVSLSEAAVATRVKIQILTALEKDDYSNIPAPVYAKGFVRMYAEYLELDQRKCIEEYVAQVGAAARPAIPREIVAAQIATVDEPKKGAASPGAREPAPEPEAKPEPVKRVVVEPRGNNAGATPAGRFAAAVAAEPLKALGVAVGVAVLIAFLVSGIGRWVSHSGRAHGRGKTAAADPRRVPFEPPDTYLDVAP